MSNNKQSMKLYTEEQVIQMIEKSRETGLTADYLILTTTPIELPSDEEIESKAVLTYRGKDLNEQRLNNHLIITFEKGAKWMRDKIQGGSK